MTQGDMGEYWAKIAHGRDFHVQAVAREKREAAILRAEEAVQTHGGSILDFKMFSNVSLNLLVELTGAAALEVMRALEAAGWNVVVEPGRDVLARRSAERLEGTLQVTFPEGDGRMVIPVPAVPG